ncbi:MAG: tetratricopeptide repeat protein [Clostridia bacterium]|nr:tetratricopeptide repeat protein [Clostridia bacterium]
MARSNSIPVGRVVEKLDEYFRQNDYAGAKRHLLYWLSEAESLGDDNSVLFLNNELMGLCRKLGEGEQAFDFVRKALDRIEKMGIENNVGAATTYLNCATVYKAFERAQDAICLFEKAKMIYENNLSPQDERLGGLYNNMALAMVDLERFDEADVLYNKAISVMQANENSQPEQAITYLNMATAAEMRYGLEGAQDIISECAEKAMELMDMCKDRTDANYAFVCDKCSSVFGYYGYFLYKKELEQRSRRIYEGA